MTSGTDIRPYNSAAPGEPERMDEPWNMGIVSPNTQTTTDHAMLPTAAALKSPPSERRRRVRPSMTCMPPASVLNTIGSVFQMASAPESMWLRKGGHDGTLTVSVKKKERKGWSWRAPSSSHSEPKTVRIPPLIAPESLRMGLEMRKNR